MLVLTTAVIFGGLAILLLARLRACRSVESTRSILVHIPIDRAWALVREFPALYAAHGRGRTLLRIASSELKSGDGRSAGTIWRQRGTQAGREFWADIEIVEAAPPHTLAVRLVRDARGSERSLRRHRGELRLRPEGARSTKITWHLSARLHGVRMIFTRMLVPGRVEARLLDLSLRSLKGAIDGGARQAEAGHTSPFPRPRGAATAAEASPGESIGARRQR